MLNILIQETDLFFQAGLRYFFEDFLSIIFIDPSILTLA